MLSSGYLHGLRPLHRAHQLLWARELQIFELFSKERRAERRAALQEEAQRGYFDDFRDFRDSGGKVFLAPTALAPASAARRFPQLQAVLADGSAAAFPSVSAGAPAASLCCAAFRAGAQGMLEAWSAPFGERFSAGGSVRYYELALIESAVMARWPFRGMLLRSARAVPAASPLAPTHLFVFGPDHEALRVLHMTNKLTGYAYLLDREGRIRWQASGKPAKDEVASLIKCTQQLLDGG